MKIFISLALVFVQFFTMMQSTFLPYPAPPEGGERFTYGDGRSQDLDMFVPEDASGSVDVMFFIHGGSWVFGNQSSSFDAYAKLVCDEYGIVGVSADYTKLGLEANAVDMAEQMYTAVEFVKNTLADRGLKADKLAMCGHSSGSNTALLYSYKHYADSPIDLAFVVAAASPVGFVDYGCGTAVERGGNVLASALSGEYIKADEMNAENAAYVSVSPLMLVSADVPPTIIVHGDADRMVPYTGSVKLHEALDECGVRNDFITIENGGHAIRGNSAFQEAVTPYVEQYGRDLF